MELSKKHQQQIESLIDKKITVRYGFGKKFERVLRKDYKGLYIKDKGQRVSCKPDTSTINIISFLALDPKIEKRLEK